MTLNVEERQAAALKQMLQLRRPNGGAFAASNIVVQAGQTASTAWKVFIFDDEAKAVLAPLMTVGMLRREGVTLPLSLSTERTAIVEAPAVYLVAPTQANIDAILRDFDSKLYACYYINFTTAIPSTLLRLLAEGAAKSGVVGSVVSVVDRYISFVCLSPFEFSLHRPRSFCITHGSFPDREVEQTIHDISMGVFCVLATLGVLPVVRCPSSSSSPARVIALKLKEIVAALPAKAFAHFFGAGASSVNKPLLILLDREFDLAAMLQHTWLYGALIHDLFSLRLNRITLPVSGDDGCGGKGKTYDLEKRDSFWQQHAYAPFPTAAAAVSQSLSEYHAELDKINRRKSEGIDPESSNFSSDILKAMDALPDLADKKRSLDMHTSVASALVEEIKSRSLDKFFEVEQSIDQEREGSLTQTIRQMLAPDSPGKPEDKLRLLACLFLLRPNFPPAQFSSLCELLRMQGIGVEALDFLSHLSSFQSLQSDLLGASCNTSTASNTLEGISSKFFDKGRGILQGVKNLLMRKTSTISTVVEMLMEHKETSSFLSVELRPTCGEFSHCTAGSLQKAPSRHAIVFVTGGASFVEAAALRALANKMQSQILFGSTDFVSPDDFLGELTELGRNMKM